MQLALSFEPEVYTVSQLTQRLKGVLQQDPVLGQSVQVSGELSNVKPSSRGHLYFTLKDEKASLSGVMWASVAARLKFTPQEGMAVTATGTLDVYAPSGSYSLVTKALEPQGIGALQLAFEQLKARLAAEGLFDQERKRPLPEFPLRIGMVTAATGAVVHDMMRVIRRKNPVVSVVLAPVKVQGEGAAQDIARAITTLNHPTYGLDLILVARGGGSFEDLFCFSEEPVVRAIVASRLPVVTGIGHEPDYALADAAADESAATPTAAAELAVPDVGELLGQLQAVELYLADAMQRSLGFAEQRLDNLADQLASTMDSHLREADYSMTRLTEQLTDVMATYLDCCEQQVTALGLELDAFSPLKTLSRGYAAVSWVDTQTNKHLPLKTVAQVAPSALLNLRLTDGTIQAKALKVNTLGSE